MKKKIILFLSFLLTAMFLTSCSEKTLEKTIKGTKIEEMTEIANNVVNEKGYKLPDGYKVSYPDETTNSRIKVTDDSDSPNCIVEAVFDVSGKQPKLLEISTSSILASLLFGVILSAVIIGAIISSIVRFICIKVKRLQRNKKNKNE